ncbi:helix-turn-helix domain-containing protein [Kitasatospora sp. NPDC047058]|uniref:winged helix-turn-helix transcriptional regulator n=1 Tax=Kitasatospora sp. NPDC047058 TaxID=3155620 RepID=UPI00340FB471
MAQHEVATDGTDALPGACTATPVCTGADVALTRVFSLLGKRWTGLILAVLTHNGPAYFSELRRAVPGISERMLSDRLTELADAGLVLRRVDEGPPLRVSYRLSQSRVSASSSIASCSQPAATCSSLPPRSATPCATAARCSV